MCALILKRRHAQPAELDAAAAAAAAAAACAADEWANEEDSLVGLVGVGEGREVMEIN